MGIDGKHVTICSFASVLAHQFLHLSKVDDLSPLLFIVTLAGPIELPGILHVKQCAAPKGVIDLANSVTSDSSVKTNISGMTGITQIMEEGKFTRKMVISDRMGEEHRSYPLPCRHTENKSGKNI